MKDLYEKDYTTQETQMIITSPEAEDIEIDPAITAPDEPRLTLMDVYEVYDKVTAKRIIPEDKANYDYLLKRCDELAQRYHGQVSGVVDHDKFDSRIRLTVPRFLEFCFDDELVLLKEIAEKARTVSFEAAAEGGLRLSIFINYFAEEESFESFVARKTKRVLERQGLTPEEAAAKSQISVEEFMDMLNQ